MVVRQWSASVTERCVDAWAERPAADLVLSLSVIAVHVVCVWRFSALKMLPWADGSQRLAVYAAGAGMMSLIAGFAGTAIAVYGSASGSVVRELRMVHGAKIRKNWKTIIGWLLISAVLCIVSMVVDAKDSSNFSEWIFEFAILQSIGKFFRLILVFRLVLQAVDLVEQDDSEEESLEWIPKSEAARYEARRHGA